MTIKEILAKVVAGEELTEEDKNFVAGYDNEKVLNETAAAARRKAEARLAELDAERARLAAELTEKDSQLGAFKTTHKTEIDELGKRLEAIEKARVDAENKAKTLERSKQIEQLRINKKINFVPNIDQSFASEAFERAFSDFEKIDPEDAKTSETITKWVEKNKAIILDTTGTGSGQKASPSNDGTKAKDLEKMSDAELLEYMKSKKLL